MNQTQAVEMEGLCRRDTFGASWLCGWAPGGHKGDINSWGKHKGHQGALEGQVFVERHIPEWVLVGRHIFGWVSHLWSRHTHLPGGPSFWLRDKYFDWEVHLSVGWQTFG